MIIASTRYGELGLSFIAYAHDQEKNKTKQKKKETKTVGGLLLLETVGHKTLKKTEK